MGTPQPSTTAQSSPANPEGWRVHPSSGLAKSILSEDNGGCYTGWRAIEQDFNDFGEMVADPRATILTAEELGLAKTVHPSTAAGQLYISRRQTESGHDHPLAPSVPPTVPGTYTHAQNMEHTTEIIQGCIWPEAPAPGADDMCANAMVAASSSLCEVVFQVCLGRCKLQGWR